MDAPDIRRERYQPSSTDSGRMRIDDQLFDELRVALAPSYVLVKQIGQGGMGSVFLARDPALKRSVAVKLLSPELSADAEARTRFQREAQAVAAISHPNVVAVYSVGEVASGVPFFVMQFINGQSFADRLAAEGPLEPANASRVVGEVASALAAAHRQDIIHRDIKPANVFWDQDNGRALVGDFGIASIARHDERDESHLTQAGMTLGSPAYMSPEQFLAERVTDKTDVYSLGMLGYELLTGRGPYEVSSPGQLMAAHLQATPRKLAATVPDVSPELEAILEACLAKDAAARPTAEEVARRLAHGSDAMLEWPPPGLEPLHGKAVRAIRFLALGSTALTLPLALLSGLDEDSDVQAMLPSHDILALVGAIGLVVFGAALVSLARQLAVALPLIRSGYGWGTVAEAWCDVRRDTGALMAGSREYASLSSTRRSTLRRLRVVSTPLLLSAAILPPLSFFLALPAARAAGPGAVFVTTFALPLLIGVIGVLAGAWEHWSVREARARFARPAADPRIATRIVAAWNAVFERVRTGQSLGQGPVGHRVALLSLFSAVAALSLAGAAVGYAMTLYGIVVTALAGSSVPTHQSLRRYARELPHLAPYRPPVDESISAMRAGEALHAITVMGRERQLTSLERPAARALRGTYDFNIDSRTDLFKWPGWRVDAIRRAPRGFTAEQRVFLERAAAHPGLDELAVLSRAGSVDYASAALRLPVPTGTSPWEIPTPDVRQARSLMVAAQARAALELADGRPAAAESLLRDVIGAGLLLSESNDMGLSFSGAVMAVSGGSALQAFYEVTGKLDDAQRLSRMSDTSIANESRRSDTPARSGMRDYIRDMRRSLPDTTIPRSIRWQYATEVLPYEPCSDLRQLIFGPLPAYHATFAEARRALVRTRSDSLLFSMAEQTLERPVASSGWWLGRVLARGLDRMTGARRFESCVSLLISAVDRARERAS